MFSSTGSGTPSSAEVLTANVAPVADAGTPVEGDEGSSFTFSGAASGDPDGDALMYRWDFGDGSPVATGVEVSHIYVDNGTFTVTLTVSDGLEESTATTTATVRNVAPVVSLVLGTDPAVSGQPYVASGSFVDPGADVWTALVHYGDGSSVSPLELSDKAFRLSHVYASAGTFLITVIVTDDDGDVAVASGEVRVVSSNRAPVADAGALTVAGREGGVVRFDGTDSSDPDGDLLTYAWDFGDGAAAAGVTAEHVYADDGTYTVQLTVSDGTLSATATLTAVIANVAPTVGAFAGAALLPGDLYTAGGSFADPGADAWSATVDYGDGSGGQALLLSDRSFALSHTYRQAGTFTVTVTVTDDDGGVGVSSATVVVRTLQQLVGQIAWVVEDLQASGALNPPNANSLTASLDGAIAKLDAGDLDGAINSLDVFINKVEGLVKTGRLTAADAAPLLEQARRLRRIIRALLAG
jgi:PKD repeat protein